MPIESQEDEMFKTFRLTHPSVVADGAVNEADFISARYRNVYIFKEVNGDSGWDLRDYIYDGGRV